MRRLRTIVKIIIFLEYSSGTMTYALSRRAFATDDELPFSTSQTDISTTPVSMTIAYDVEDGSTTAQLSRNPKISKNVGAASTAGSGSKHSKPSKFESGTPTSLLGGFSSESPTKTTSPSNSEPLVTEEKYSSHGNFLSTSTANQTTTTTNVELETMSPSSTVGYSYTVVPPTILEQKTASVKLNKENESVPQSTMLESFSNPPVTTESEVEPTLTTPDDTTSVVSEMTPYTSTRRRSTLEASSTVRSVLKVVRTSLVDLTPTHNVSMEGSDRHVHRSTLPLETPAVKDEETTATAAIPDRASTKTSVSQTVSLESVDSTTTHQVITIEHWWKPEVKNKEGHNKALQYFLRFAVVAPILLFVVAMLLYLYYNLRKISRARKRARERRMRKEREAKEPREVEQVTLDMSQFKDKGPLIMKTSFCGDVKHALQDIRSTSLRTLVFDTAQNSLVKIGTEVEKIVGHTEQTQDSEKDLMTCKSLSQRRTTDSAENTTPDIPERPPWMIYIDDSRLATCITTSASEKQKTGLHEEKKKSRIPSLEATKTSSAESTSPRKKGSP
ncbi:hypothetical protein GCK32_010968 [Trichostrongylus colubriformis]|uniref:Uncharacterized protein n=1 Tax=Trichostrongylus colubriformis TaxID=6319 RepID=A0AAN8FMU0_TRICO